VKELRKNERQDETWFTTKIDEKTSLGSSYFCFVKFSLPVTRLMPYYAKTGRSRPPNHVTLRISLILSLF
jgi:hypothetical protein